MSNLLSTEWNVRNVIFVPKLHGVEQFFNNLNFNEFFKLRRFVTYIWHLKRAGTNAIKFENIGILSSKDVFAAFALVLLKLPIFNSPLSAKTIRLLQRSYCLVLSKTVHLYACYCTKKAKWCNISENLSLNQSSRLDPIKVHPPESN